MRLVGYLILLLLAFYFLFLKPYLLAKRVYWEVEGLSFSFERVILINIEMIQLFQILWQVRVLSFILPRIS